MVYSDVGFCGRDPFWDSVRTWYTLYPQFTPCFESTVLTYIPTVILWFFAPLNCFSIPDATPKTRSNPWTLLTFCKIVTTVAVAIVYLFTAITDAMKGPEAVPLAGIIADALNAFSAVWIITLYRSDRVLGKPNNTVVFTYWSLMMLFYLPKYYRFMVQAFVVDFPYRLESEQQFISTAVVYPLIVLNFFMNCFSESTPYRKLTEKPSPILTAPPLSALVFEWITPFIVAGYKHFITTEDLFDPLPETRSERNCAAFSKVWEAELKKSNYDPLTAKYDEKKPPSLFKAFAKLYYPSVLLATVIIICRSFIRSTPALLLNLITNYVADSSQPLWKGVLFTVGIFTAQTASSFCFRAADYTLAIMGVKIKSIIIGMIYRKALKLSSASQGAHTVGEIVTMVSVDADRVFRLSVSCGAIVASPVTIFITIGLLWQYLGPSCLAGIGVILIMMPVSGALARKLQVLQNYQMKLKDKRMKGMTEIFNSIKILKLFAWEPPFTDRVSDIRSDEVAVLKKTAYLTAATGFFWTCTPFLVALCSFMTFVLVSSANILDPTVAFVSLTLFNQMRFSMVVVPDFISNFIQTRVSFKRIHTFLLSQEMSPDTIGKNPKDDDVITISNAVLSWPLSDTPVLKNIDISIEKGKLVAIVGQVGSGKSSILSAILGDLVINNGSIDVDGEIAYIPQQAWIRNATIRDNIVFTSPWNVRKYQKVVEASCLRRDFEILAGGDKTEIGEKGINLSGGQKQRVSIARAVYQDSEVYLFDDPLSAVDAHVASSMFNNIIGPKSMLKSKTRVLVTNNLSVLPDTDYIFVLKDGEIVESGDYATLSHAKGLLSDLWNEYMQQAKEPQTPAEEIVLSEKFDDEAIAQNLRRRVSTMSGSIASLIEAQQSGEFQLVEKETVEEGAIKGKIYTSYLKHIGSFMIFVVLFFYIAYRGLDLTNGMWLSAWSMDPPLPDGSPDIHQRNVRLAVYAVIGLVQGLCNFLGVAFLTMSTIKASSSLHTMMLRAIMRAPLSFFDVTPVGRLLNRFGKDLDQLDIQLPFITNFALEMFFQIIGMVVLISINLPVYIAIAVPVLAAFIFLRQIFVKTLRQVKRLESVARSPVNNHVSETMNGLSSIRSYGVQDVFTKQNNELVDKAQNCSYHVQVCNYWMSIRLEFLGNLLIFVMAMLIVVYRDLIDAGTAGLLISYSLSAAVAFNYLVYFSTEVEATIIAAERLDEYTCVTPEAPWHSEHPPPLDWPSKGRVTFDKYSTRYREGLDFVLKDVSLDVQPQHKVGIVGRTGAGKSSLILSLFRIIEAVNGKIVIDDLDIEKLGLHEIRSKLTIIPQESVLFNGTLRMNLDPNDEYDDFALWTALERAHLKALFVPGHGLDSEITEGGQNLSVGQRQLVCLARAVLRKTRILVLDEATAAVDLETDALIQETIRKVFSDSTIITIAHRINTILDSDVVVVMAAGGVLECGSPQTLLADEKSEFYSLAKEAGVVN